MLNPIIIMGLFLMKSSIEKVRFSQFLVRAANDIPNQVILYCQSRVTVKLCFVYKVIKDL